MTTDDRALQVQTKGAVTEHDIDYARQKISAALDDAPKPVLFARATLTRLADPARERPNVVQVNVDLDGKPLHAQASRPTMREATDEVEDRLRQQLRRQAGHWEALRGNRATTQPVVGPPPTKAEGRKP